MRIDELMKLAPVIPVLVVESVQDGRSIAEALVGGSLPVLEVTLRMPCALDVIRERRKVEGAVVGAGTVVNERQMDEALLAGVASLVVV